MLLAAARLGEVPRRTATVFLAAVLLFSVPVIIVMEMAPAQISLFLKRTDQAGFLRAPLPPFASIEKLREYASDTDVVASVGNWAAAYAPNPAQFEHVYRTRWKYDKNDVRTVLRPESRFPILPIQRI